MEKLLLQKSWLRYWHHWNGRAGIILRGTANTRAAKSVLQNSGIVPHVVPGIDDATDPATELVVRYPTAYDVTNGNDIPKDKAQDEPNVSISGGDGLYTLLMTDPDAPSPDHPRFAEYLHWMAIDIPGSFGNVSGGKVKVPYMGPAPPMGKHRYIFTLWRQTPPGDPNTIAKEDWDQPIKVTPPKDRRHFSTKKFAKEHNLHGPIRVDFFYSEP